MVQINFRHNSRMILCMGNENQNLMCGALFSSSLKTQINLIKEIPRRVFEHFIS